MLSNLAFCENENEYAELVISKLFSSQLLHWKFVWLHCVVATPAGLPELLNVSFWDVTVFSQCFVCTHYPFIHFICGLVELCRNPFDFSHTLAVTAVLSMKCFAEESRAVCFRDGGYNRHFSIVIFFF